MRCETVNGITLSEHFGLVWSVVKRHRWGLGASLEESDLFQAGFFGLLRAAQKFEPARGYAFSTYALHWVRARVRRVILDQRRTVRVPVWAQEKARERGEALPRTLSLDAPIDARDQASATLLDRLVADDGGEHQEHERREVAAKALALLPERERAMLRARFLDGITLAEIGQRHGVTRERVRQITEASIGKLRQQLAGDAT